jgi:hypothetical protein
MRVALAGLAAVLALTAAGCGEAAPTRAAGATDAASSTGSPTDGSSTPTPSASTQPELPRCGQVWVVGQKLPKGYDGCLTAGDPADDPRGIPCESGQTLFRHGERLYAIEGGKVVRTAQSVREDDIYRRILAACTA